MSNSSRLNESFLKRFLIYIKLIYQIIKDLANNQTTFKLIYIKVINKIFFKPKLNDDFNWDVYHLHYKEELRSGDKNYTLNCNTNDFKIKKSKIIKKDEKIKDLHPNHKLLYETILKINPRTILEIGCGGGDHLANLSILNRKFKLLGIDRSFEQIKILKQRHPKLKVSIKIKDITIKNNKLETADLVFTQAVLMHISESNNRFRFALNNILEAANSHIILIENWTAHNFLNEIKKIIRDVPKYKSFKFYISKLSSGKSARAMVLSKKKLPLPKLLNYNDLLQGNILRTH